MNKDLELNEKPTLESSQIEKEISSDPANERNDQIPPPKVDVRQIQDEGEISKRVDELPDELRKSLVDEFKVNFVSIEKIDPKQLI